MVEKEPDSESQRVAREESAVVRGWLRLAEDVLSTSKTEEVADSDQPA